MSKTAAQVVRRRGRRDANGAFGLGTTTPNYAWDFVNNKARFNNINYGALANTPGWSFTRASTGYAQTSAGVLVPFASGTLRRTDKGVLIEGARTNLCLQSQTLDVNGSGTPWNHTGATVTANAAVAPDGTTTADKVIPNNAATAGRAEQTFTVSSATTYTVSFYAKAGEISWARLRSSVDSAHSVWFNLATGAVGTREAEWISASIQSLANGWYRCIASYTTTGTSFAIRPLPVNADFSGYTGDGTSGLYFWGFQLEAAAFPSSYIPTTTASATRAADVLTVPVSGLDYPLSLFAEFERAVDTGGAESVFVTDVVAGSAEASLGVSAADLARVFTETADVTQSDITVAGALAVGTTYRAAARIAANDFQIARGGTLGTADTSGTAPAAPTIIRFGSRVSSAQPLFGYLRRCAIWPRALTDAELQAVTR